MVEDKFNLEFYKGEDLYSDGAVEDELLKALRESDQISEILMSHDEWPFLYHFSPIRENLLEWFDFDPNGSVLEIGSGCGAISGLLCRKAKRVVGIELSYKRSLINATKNQTCSNLELIIGNFEDIRLKEKFDYITLIGVLEYAQSYIHSKNPFEEMLQRARSLLKSDGTLIIAIENRFGLKYWAGASEDHTGGIFDGIEGYEGVQSVKTFSKPQMEKLLKKSGFVQTEFYYPMPDYKMPTVLYSDQRLPKSGELRNMSEVYDRPRIQLFHEAAVYDSLCEDHMFPYFANSFLIFAG